MNAAGKRCPNERYTGIECNFNGSVVGRRVQQACDENHIGGRVVGIRGGFNAVLISIKVQRFYFCVLASLIVDTVRSRKCRSVAGGRTEIGKGSVGGYRDKLQGQCQTLREQCMGQQIKIVPSVPADLMDVSESAVRGFCGGPVCGQLRGCEGSVVCEEGEE